MKYHIFVEGEADKRFIEQLLCYLKIAPQEDGVVVTNGCDNLLSKGSDSPYAIIMQRGTSDNEVNLVIFDADNDISVKRKKIDDWAKSNGLNFKLYLFPDNSSNGDFEDLLTSIINPDNEPVMDCWRQYEKLISVVRLPWRKGMPLTIPAKKTKIYAYLEVLLGASKSEKNKIKERNRDYLNSNHWNLGAPELQGLLRFLSENLQ